MRRKRLVSLGVGAALLLSGGVAAPLALTGGPASALVTTHKVLTNGLTNTSADSELVMKILVSCSSKYSAGTATISNLNMVSPSGVSFGQSDDLTMLVTFGSSSTISGSLTENTKNGLWGASFSGPVSPSDCAGGAQARIVDHATAGFAINFHGPLSS
jgi:hypothetical protein